MVHLRRGLSRNKLPLLVHVRFWCNRGKFQANKMIHFLYYCNERQRGACGNDRRKNELDLGNLSRKTERSGPNQKQIEVVNGPALASDRLGRGFFVSMACRQADARSRRRLITQRN